MGKLSLKKVRAHNEASAKLANVRVSPRKLGLVAGLVRGMNVEEARVQLKFCPRRISDEVLKLLESAIANAENNHNLNMDSLYIYRVNVGKAFVMKRFHARARGRGVKVIKPFSNIEIILRERE